MQKTYVPEPLAMAMEAMGLVVGLDYDDTLTVEVPEQGEFTRESIAEWLRDPANPLNGVLVSELDNRRRRTLTRCIGGPLDGQRHGWSGWRFANAPTFTAVHVARAKWACYRVERDGRAFFIGYASNRQKAKRGEAIQPRSDT